VRSAISIPVARVRAVKHLIRVVGDIYGKPATGSPLSDRRPLASAAAPPTLISHLSLSDATTRHRSPSMVPARGKRVSARQQVGLGIESGGPQCFHLGESGKIDSPEELGRCRSRIPWTCVCVQLKQLRAERRGGRWPRSLRWGLFRWCRRYMETGTGAKTERRECFAIGGALGLDLGFDRGSAAGRAMQTHLAF
jgi:hypothetical protein